MVRKKTPPEYGESPCRARSAVDLLHMPTVVFVVVSRESTHRTHDSCLPVELNVEQKKEHVSHPLSEPSHQTICTGDPATR